MKSPLKKILATAIVAGLTIPTVASATNGYFLIGFGAKSRGMAGVGVAYPQDGLASSVNPAGMSEVGDRFDIGGALFFPDRGAIHESTTLPGEVDSRGDIFLIPNMGYVEKINDQLSWGFSVIGAGLGTEYDQRIASGGNGTSNLFNFNPAANNFEADGDIGVMLIQMQMLPSISYKLDNKNSIGASLVIAAQMFEGEGFQSFGTLGFTSANEKFTNEGKDYSFGAGIRLGWLGKFMEDDKLMVGVNYSSRVYMSEFEDYRNLFAEQGDFDIPENYSVGISYKVTPKMNVAFDVQRINYNDIASVGNPGPDANDPSNFFSLCPGADKSACKTGGDLGLGFGWKNQTIYKLGMDYKIDSHWTARAGYNYGETPIPDDEVLFNIIAPATVEHHITVGGTYEWSDSLEISFNYMHAFENTIKGRTAFPPNSSAPLSPGDSNASISMVQDAFEASLGFKF